MGRVVKADPRSLATPETEARGCPRTSEAVAAEITELLIAARAAALAERAAAKDIAMPLARKMAEKIVGRAIELEPAMMGDILAQVMSGAKPRGPVVLRVHPEDLAAVQSTRAQWLGKLAATDCRLQPDESVGRGGCVVETPVGRLDARLQTQLDALERALRTSAWGRT